MNECELYLCPTCHTKCVIKCRKKRFIQYKGEQGSNVGDFILCLAEQIFLLYPKHRIRVQLKGGKRSKEIKRNRERELHGGSLTK